MSFLRPAVEGGWSDAKEGLPPFLSPRESVVVAGRAGQQASQWVQRRGPRPHPPVFAGRRIGRIKQLAALRVIDDPAALRRQMMGEAHGLVEVLDPVAPH